MTELSLLELRRSLRAAAVDDPVQPPHARAFAEWIQHDKIDQAQHLKSLAEEAAQASGPARQTAHAAVLGYAANLDVSFAAALEAAFDWLTQRTYFAPGRPSTFEVDGLGLLGVAVGLGRLDQEKGNHARAWLSRLLQRTLQSQRPADWNESLIASAHNMIVSVEAGQAYWASADLKAALCGKGLTPTTSAMRESAWDIISGADCSDDGMTRAAAQSAALSYLLRDASTLRFGSVTVDDVSRLLQAVLRSMRYWAWDIQPRTARSALARWNVENEYHVQNMLGVILAPYFPDLDDEEWLKSLGQHHPRGDFAIPSLELIIEVKFLRQGTTSALSKLIQEVASDASTYLQDGSGYKHIIAFVWDDSASTEQHPELRQGLTRITGVRDAIVLPRPAKMTREATPSKSKADTTA